MRAAVDLLPPGFNLAMSLFTRRRLLRGVGGLLLWGIIVGPWPVRDEPFVASDYAKRTEARSRLSPRNRGIGAIQVGVAEVDLSPQHPIPLAGYIGGIAQPYVGIISPSLGKALTVAGPHSSVTILAADVLLIDDRLARAILQRVGLSRDQVYFTATHTHGGPGGWGVHPLERLVAGSFSPEDFDRLAGLLAEVVVRSRVGLVPAEVGFVRVDAQGMQRNRINPAWPTDAMISAWSFRSPAPLPGRRGPHPVLATFAIFGAHATVAHPNPPRLHADYPEAFAADLARQLDVGTVLFAAGTVGDTAPVRADGGNERHRIDVYGQALAARLAPVLQTIAYHAEVELENRCVKVDLPPVQLPCVQARLRMSPFSTWWVGRRSSYVHVVRLGPALLAGFPGDYASELGRTLRAKIPVVSTSFNGDYKGYLVAKSTFHARACYETRWMSLYGPGLGEYLTSVVQAELVEAGAAP